LVAVATRPTSAGHDDFFGIRSRSAAVRRGAAGDRFDRLEKKPSICGGMRIHKHHAIDAGRFE
jgi:hypothetical protein